QEIGYFHNREARLHHTEIDHGTHLYRHVIARHNILRRDLESVDTKRNLDHPVDRREDQNHARTLGLRHQAAQAEDDPALVFAKHLDRAQQIQNDDNNCDGGEVDHGSASDSTVSFSLSIWVTRTRVPAGSGRCDTAFQYSPCTKTFPSGASSVTVAPVSPII